MSETKNFINPELVPVPKAAEYIATVNLEDLQAKLTAAGIDFADKMEKFPVPEKGSLYGIQELKDVVLFGVYVIKAIVLKNTNVLARWLAVVTAIPGAIVGIGEVPLEIKDMDEEELNELIAYIQSLLPEITRQAAIDLIEHSIKVAFGLYSIVNLIKELKQPEQ